MKECKIDVETRKVWQKKYGMTFEPCVLTQAVTGFDIKTCKRRETCKQTLETIKN